MTKLEPAVGRDDAVLPVLLVHVVHEGAPPGGGVGLVLGEELSHPELEEIERKYCRGVSLVPCGPMRCCLQSLVRIFT